MGCKRILLISRRNDESERTMTTPAKILDSQRFTWVKPEATDIMKTFERFGYIRPSKNLWFHEKWEHYRLPKNK